MIKKSHDLPASSLALKEWALVPFSITFQVYQVLPYHSVTLPHFCNFGRILHNLPTSPLAWGKQTLLFNMWWEVDSFNSSLWLSALISIQLTGNFLAVNSTPTVSSVEVNCQIAIDFHGGNAAYPSWQSGPKTLTSVTLLLVYHKHPSMQAQTINCSVHCLLN